MKSANQRYKESKTDMSFKNWLKLNQSKGLLKNHEKMINYDGVNEISVERNKNKLIRKNTIIGLVSISILILGLYQVSTRVSE